MMVLLLSWVLVGIVCSAMAGNRGRSEMNGFLAGLFFGIFAIIYYVLSGDTNELRAEKIKAILGKK